MGYEVVCKSFDGDIETTADCETYEEAVRLKKTLDDNPHTGTLFIRTIVKL